MKVGDVCRVLNDSDNEIPVGSLVRLIEYNIYSQSDTRIMVYAEILMSPPGTNYNYYWFFEEELETLNGPPQEKPNDHVEQRQEEQN